MDRPASYFSTGVRKNRIVRSFRKGMKLRALGQITGTANIIVAIRTLKDIDVMREGHCSLWTVSAEALPKTSGSMVSR